MMLLRLLNPQGIAGLAAAAVLALLLIAAKIDARHLRRSNRRSSSSSIAPRPRRMPRRSPTSGSRPSAPAPPTAPMPSASTAAQASISERITNDFEARLADARARAHRLRGPTPAPTDRGGGRSAAVSGLPAAAAGAAEAAGQDRLPDPDRLIATEQAIQLDALIRWVRAQASVDPNHRTGE